MEGTDPLEPANSHTQSRESPRAKVFNLIILLIILSSGISGCVTLSDPESSQDYTSDVVGILDGRTSLGQSFVSRRPNLNGLVIWLNSVPGQNDSANQHPARTIIARIYHSSINTEPIFTTSVNSPLSGNNVPVTITLPDQHNPAGENYYVLLTIDAGSIQVTGRKEDAYPHGQAFINGNPINADIAFRLSYNYDLPAFALDSTQFIANSWLILPMLIILWLPGWLLLELSGFRSRFDFGSQTALAIGLSLAIIPLVMLWTTLLKLKWSRQSVLFVAGFLIAIFIVRLVYRAVSLRRSFRKLDESQLLGHSGRHQAQNTKLSITTLALILIFLGSLTSRLIMVRDLATPAWVDSVHHALITRLILSSGSYPSSYQPYLDISTSSYHPGFHSIASTLIWLTNLNLPRALLILGQVLNALSVFTIYLITITLTGSSVAGVFGAFIAGFLTPMPAYYTSWGRYTELTGLLIFPVILALINLLWEKIAKPGQIWIIVLGAISAAGLFMVHYRVIVFLACLIIPFILIQSIARKPSIRILWMSLLLPLAMAGLSILFVFPWFIQLIKTSLLPKISLPVITPVPFFQDFSWPYLSSALGKQALLLVALGFIWSLIKRRSFAITLSIWLLILFFLANLDALKLSGGGLVTNISVEIILFIPISILGGYLISQILINWKGLLPKRIFIPVVAVITLLAGFVAYQGSRQLIPILNPATILTRNADLPAIQWISQNIPENETIAINQFAWGYGLFAGNDGGYWIAPLSGRATLPPAVLYGLGHNLHAINQEIQSFQSVSTDPIALADFLKSSQLHYLYAGARGGIIPPSTLASSGLFKVLYHQDGVWIFSIKP